MTYNGTTFPHPEPAVSQSLRKLIGSLAIIVLVTLYSVLATTIASARLADAGGWVHLIYFSVTGLLWIVPAMFIIKWMLRPDKVDAP